MNIIYSDDSDRLTAEIKDLMQQAADEALRSEFGEGLGAAGFTPGDINAEIGVTVVEDEEIRSLNRDYRGIDKVTDVLSFPQFEGHEELLEALIESGAGSRHTQQNCSSVSAPGENFATRCAGSRQPVLAGDVVICFDQAVRQAEEYGTGFTREVLYLFVHSIMHIFGYDHIEEADKKVMREHEERVLSAMGIVRQTI